MSQTVPTPAVLPARLHSTAEQQEAEIAEFEAMTARFERGELEPDVFRKYRLARGVYGQKQTDVQMIRVKIPQGVIRADQLRALADVSERWSRGYGHVTTRQNLQFHFVKLADAPAVLRHLATVELTTREACGNTVRTVTACTDAGVCGTEAFDVSPYGLAITRHFLRNGIAQDLPRKFKIAMSGCESACALDWFHCIGLTARVRDGQRGFRMVIGGGLSTNPMEAKLLYDFIPVTEFLAAAEAVVRVFNVRGDRKNKAKARLKYVLRRMDWAAFKAEYDLSYAEVHGRMAAAGELVDPTVGKLTFTDVTPPPAAPRVPETTAPPLVGYTEWVRTNARVQNDPRFYMVRVTLPLGDINAAQMRAVADLVERHSEGAVRAGVDQNLVIRYVSAAALPEVHRELVAMGLGEPGAQTIRDVTSCPGAESCQLAYTASRGLAREVRDRLAQPDAQRLVAMGESLPIKISGCPHSCGQHQIAAIGFHGGIKKIGGKVVPHYQVHLGGHHRGDGADFGRDVVKVPAKRAPEVVVRLLALYEKEKQPGEDALTFFKRVEIAVAKEALHDLSDMTVENAKPDEYTDWDSTGKAFAVEIGPGECAA